MATFFYDYARTDLRVKGSNGIGGQLCMNDGINSN